MVNSETASAPTVIGRISPATTNPPLPTSTGSVRASLEGMAVAES
jgi:hypothetical protein